LTVFAAESFDFILATDNVIDALPHHDRLRALGEAYRLLRPGGILVFSCHEHPLQESVFRSPVEMVLEPRGASRKL